MKKYNIIYADPPWSYRDKALSGNRGAGCKYKVQSKEWLENLQITNIADKNCILFLWVTMPKLNEGFDLIKNWGFEYKTVAFTWIKKNKVTDSLFWGIALWTLLIAFILSGVADLYINTITYIPGNGLWANTKIFLLGCNVY